MTRYISEATLELMESKLPSMAVRWIEESCQLHKIYLAVGTTYVATRYMVYAPLESFRYTVMQSLTAAAIYPRVWKKPFCDGLLLKGAYIDRSVLSNLTIPPKSSHNDAPRRKILCYAADYIFGCLAPTYMDALTFEDIGLVSVKRLRLAAKSKRLPYFPDNGNIFGK